MGTQKGNGSGGGERRRKTTSMSDVLAGRGTGLTEGNLSQQPLLHDPTHPHQTGKIFHPISLRSSAASRSIAKDKHQSRRRQTTRYKVPSASATGQTKPRQCGQHRRGPFPQSSKCTSRPIVVGSAVEVADVETGHPARILRTLSILRPPRRPVS